MQPRLDLIYFDSVIGPLIIDVGASGPEGNTAKLTIRDHEAYTGIQLPRTTSTSAAGTVINSAYYGENNMIDELMTAATELFGTGCVLQAAARGRPWAGSNWPQPAGAGSRAPRRPA